MNNIYLLPDSIYITYHITYHILITFFITEGGKKSPVPPIFRRNLENVTFENRFSEKRRPTILQSYKLFFFSNL